MGITIALNMIVLFIVLTTIVLYGLNIKVPYPRYIINNFNEPLIRFLSYIALYFLCAYNQLLGLFFGLGLLLLHIDFINLSLR